MNIHIYTYAPAPSPYCREGRKEYEKRLGRYCKIKHSLLKNEKQQNKALAAFLNPAHPPGNPCLVLVHAGLEKSTEDSPSLARWIEEAGISGIPSLVFFVGFPEECGFPPGFFTKSLSVSRMHFGPDLLSLILEEQLYRAYRIIHGEPYHK